MAESPPIDPIAIDNAIEAADDRVEELLLARERARSGGPELHKVQGVGRFAVPRTKGWPELHAVISDKALDLDFSELEYPNFDGIVARNFNSDEFVNPLNEHYEKWHNLRQNVAAVRNYMIMNYFNLPPEKLAAGKAEKSLQEIAKFVGLGLNNNYLFFGMIPNHDASKPFISIDEANKPNGEGAAYIYERILNMQRQSDWLKPFEMVAKLFGAVFHDDWHLPDIHDTPFAEENRAIPIGSSGPTEQEIAAAEAEAMQLRGGRAQRRANNKLTAMAMDLDGLGNQLLFSAENAHQVAGLSEPVRRDAIDIAKDILRKLKIKLGDKNVIDGLNMNPEDDLAVVGSIKGVVLVYEKLLAYARSVDPNIMNDPAIGGATQAIGQIGYLAKLEAMRLANMASNSSMANMISAQIKRVQQQFAQASDTNFGGLLDRVDRGIDAVLNRLQTLSGPSAMVGNTVEQNIQGFMNSTPLAGQQLLVASQGEGQNKAFKMNSAIDDMQRAQAQRMQQSISSEHNKRSTSVSRSQTGRQAVQTARAQRSSASAVRTSNSNIPSAYLSSNARMTMMRRNAAMMGYHHDEEEHHPHGGHPAEQVIAKLDPRILQGIRSSTNVNNLTGAPVGPRSARNTSTTRSQTARNQPINGFYAAPANAKPAATAAASHHDDHHHDDHHHDHHDQHNTSHADSVRPDLVGMPPRGGGGRGF